MKRQTIYEIAEKAGVSPATVSRVINNYKHVQKDTRAKVLRYLEEGNYDITRSFNVGGQQSRIIGILIADMRTSHHTDGVYYIEHEFSKHNYSCLIYNTGTDPKQQEKYIRLLSLRHVDAVILMGSIYQNVTVQNAIMINMPNTPIAVCNGYFEGPNIYGVLSDEKAGVIDAIRKLAEKGRRNFLFIANHYTPSNKNKLEGFKIGINTYASHSWSKDIKTGDSIDEIEVGVKKAIKDFPNIDAIIFVEDYVAIAGLHALIEMNIQIPEQIAVVGINNSRYAAICNPSLSSIDNLLYDLSLMAVRNILNVLDGEHVNHKMVISPTLIERKTT